MVTLPNKTVDGAVVGPAGLITVLVIYNMSGEDGITKFGVGCAAAVLITQAIGLMALVVGAIAGNLSLARRRDAVLTAYYAWPVASFGAMWAVATSAIVANDDWVGPVGLVVMLVSLILAVWACILVVRSMRGVTPAA
jgi:hypothetical protein